MADRTRGWTAYNGTRFRSRLEARWAAWFDLANWEWAYQPDNLVDRTPNFVLCFPWRPMLVDVKPAKTIEELRMHVEGVDRIGWPVETLLLGVGPVIVDGMARLGLLKDVGTHEFDGLGWDVALMHTCLSCEELSMHHESGRWVCRRCGAYDGNGLIEHVPPADAIAMWRQAVEATL